MVLQHGVRLNTRLMNFQRREFEPTIHEVSKELTRLGEQMNTNQAKYEGALDRLRADMAQKDTAFERLRTDMAQDMAQKDSAFEKLRTDMAKRDAEMAQRESNRVQWQIGIWIGGVLVTIAVLGIFIRLAI